METVENYLRKHSVLDGRGNMDGAWVPLSVAMIAVKKYIDNKLIYNRPSWHSTKNPFPEYGKIKEIQLKTYVSFNKIIDQDKTFSNPVYPDEFELVLVYEKYKATYKAFNITEQDYKDLKECLLDNSKFEAIKEGWPYDITWKNYKFKVSSIEEVLAQNGIRFKNE
jgi:hypothetical protein